MSLLMAENSKRTVEQLRAEELSDLLEQRKPDYRVEVYYQKKIDLQRAANWWHFRFKKTPRDMSLLYVADEVVSDLEPDQIMSLLDRSDWEKVLEDHRGKDVPCLTRTGFAFVPLPK